MNVGHETKMESRGCFSKTRAHLEKITLIRTAQMLVKYDECTINFKLADAVISEKFLRKCSLLLINLVSVR